MHPEKAGRETKGGGRVGGNMYLAPEVWGVFMAQAGEPSARGTTQRSVSGPLARILGQTAGNSFLPFLPVFFPFLSLPQSLQPLLKKAVGPSS